MNGSILSTLLLMCSAAQASDWHSIVAEKDGSRTFIDSAGLQVSGDIRRVEWKTVYLPHTERGEGADADKWIDVRLYRSAFDCYQGLHHAEEMSTYFSNGTIWVVPPEYLAQIEWEQIPPGTGIEAILKAVCPLRADKAQETTGSTIGLVGISHKSLALGKLHLGMTSAEVERVLGRQFRVYGVDRLGCGRFQSIVPLGGNKVEVLWNGDQPGATIDSLSANLIGAEATLPAGDLAQSILRRFPQLTLEAGDPHASAASLTLGVPDRQSVSVITRDEKTISITYDRCTDESED